MSDKDNKEIDDMEMIDVSEDEKEEASKTSDDDYDKDNEYEDVCFICRRPESKAGRMFKLPNHISVC